MDTDDLIEALAADARQPGPSISSVWWSALALSIVLVAALFFAALGPRPDIAAVVDTPRFLLKFAVTITLAASAFGLVRALSRPGHSWRNAPPYLAAAPALLAMAVIMELLSFPPDAWAAKLIGTNYLVCVTALMVIGSGPLAIFIAALRRGAPTRPAFAGTVAGVLAGGIAATFYAAHCMDDSPLFVAVWYTVGIAGLAAAGAFAADRLARW